MTTEQRRALANTTPTTEVIRDAVTYPRDRLGEPLDIDGARFDAWLAQVKRDAAREALDGLADHEAALHSRDPEVYAECLHVVVSAKSWRETHYRIEDTP